MLQEEAFVGRKRFDSRWWRDEVGAVIEFPTIPPNARIGTVREKRMEKVYNLLLPEMRPLLDDLNIKMGAFSPSTKGEKNIFSCWFQGFDVAPDIVRLCWESIRVNCPEDSRIILIDKNNLDDYVSIPGWIYDLVNSQRMTLTHFSDIVRFNLLYNYGGLWLDSTLYCSQLIPEFIFKKNIWSLVSDGGSNDFYDRLTSFCIGGQKGYPAFKFLIEGFYEYWRNHRFLVEGHLINVIYAMLFRTDPKINADILTIDANCVDLTQLYRVRNDSYDFEIWNTIIQSQIFHKMDWRTDYIDNNTYYSKMREFIEQKI